MSDRNVLSKRANEGGGVKVCQELFSFGVEVPTFTCFGVKASLFEQGKHSFPIF